jgi:hypothetical protein
MNRTGTQIRRARVEWLAEMLGGMIAHSEKHGEQRIQRSLEKALRRVRRWDGDRVYRSAASDAMTITIWHSHHLQDVMTDKGVQLEPCRVCEMYGFDRPQRDAITAAQGHTKHQVEELTRL